MHVDFNNATLYDLEQPRNQTAPVLPAHVPGQLFFLHRRHEPTSGRNTLASGIIIAPDHSGTHIDALCHHAEDMQLRGGIPVDNNTQTPAGFTCLAADTISPIIKRGILLDLPRLFGGQRLPDQYLVSDDELKQVIELQGTPLNHGDVVLVRTGFGALWQRPPMYLRAAGMAATASQWLADNGPTAVGADNTSWDVSGAHDPKLNTTLPGHLILLSRAGVYILENLYLEQLARDHHYVFTFICAPLKLVGATASPVRPIALVF